MSYSDKKYDSPFFWFLYSDRFFHAANNLEGLVRKAEKISNQEVKKFLKPGEFKTHTPSKRAHKALMDRNCHHVYPYLYCHSLEVLLKGIVRAFNEDRQPKDYHSLKDFFNILKIHIEPLPFELEKIENMLSQLDGMYWAYRYPVPFPKQKDKVKHLTIQYDGVAYPSNNIGLIFDQHKETFMRLREHILNHENIKKILPKLYNPKLTK